MTRKSPGVITRSLHIQWHGTKQPAAMPLLTPTVGFTFESYEHARQVVRGEVGGVIGARAAAPTAEVAERRLAILSGAEAAILFPSGMAAVTAALLTVAKSGDTVIVDRCSYVGTQNLLRDVLTSLGIQTRAVDTSDISRVDAAMHGRVTGLLIESPGSWLLKVPDVNEISRIAHRQRARVVVDGTHATPLLQRPLSLGADLAVYSASGMLNGHGDLIAGCVAGDRATIDRLRQHARNEMGATVSPFDAWLLARSLLTLPLRVHQMCSTAMSVAESLASASGVVGAIYPLLPSHPDVGTARRTLSAGGSIITLQLRDERTVARVIDALQLCVFAVGIGGPVTTVFAPALAYSQLRPTELAERGINAGMLRVAIGLEPAEDILADLSQALAAAAA